MEHFLEKFQEWFMFENMKLRLKKGNCKIDKMRLGGRPIKVNFESMHIDCD